MDNIYTKYKFLLTYAKKVSELKTKLKNTQNEKEKELLNSAISFYEDSFNKLTNSIKGKINKPNKKISANISKNDSFRKSQQIDIDPITQAKQIDKLCIQHQQEMKSKKQISENINSR